MKQVNVYEAKTHLSALLDQAAEGEEIVIAKNGKPKAKLVHLAFGRSEAQPRERQVGVWADVDWVYADGRVHPRGEPLDIPDLTEEELADWYGEPTETAPTGAGGDS